MAAKQVFFLLRAIAAVEREESKLENAVSVASLLLKKEMAGAQGLEGM